MTVVPFKGAHTLCTREGKPREYPVIDPNCIYFGNTPSRCQISFYRELATFAAVMICDCLESVFVDSLNVPPIKPDDIWYVAILMIHLKTNYIKGDSL